tara:strand:+ start:466 stop:663 length:198 start_codon:yes stop_codon:yes gene_type:complete
VAQSNIDQQDHKDIHRKQKMLNCRSRNYGVALLACMLLIVFPVWVNASDKKPPNIIFIFVDDLDN